jgi:hypothetical protein
VALPLETCSAVGSGVRIRANDPCWNGLQPLKNINGSQMQRAIRGKQAMTDTIVLKAEVRP